MCIRDRHSWKGNIRELKNVVERAIILLPPQAELTPQELPYDIQGLHESSVQGIIPLAELEKQHIRRVLQHTQQQKTEAARLLGIGLTTLYRKIEEYKL